MESSYTFFLFFFFLLSSRFPYVDHTTVDFAFRFTQGLVTKERMDQLAAAYVFRFVGDSTMRRLAESFSSVYTELALPHAVYHKRQNYSVGNLQVGENDRSSTCCVVFSSF